MMRWEPPPDPWAVAAATAQQGTLLPLHSRRPYPLRPPTFQQNWNFPFNFHQSYHTPYRYLPWLFQSAYAWRVTIEDASYAFACNSSDITEHGSFQGLSERHLHEAYLDLLAIIQYYQDRRGISSYIRQQLSRSLTERLSRGRQPWRRSPHQAPRLFRAYAEISRQTQSRPLGDILSEFFQKHASIILSDEIGDLAIWSHAVFRSHMHDDDKYNCLALIIDICPELVDELRRVHLPVAEELWPVLAEIARRLSISLGSYRGRSRRRGPGHPHGIVASPGRSPVGRLEWENTRRSVSPSPSGSLLTPRNAYPIPRGSLITRPLSAPGRYSIIRQADRVIELVDDTAEEAQILKEMARR